MASPARGFSMRYRPAAHLDSVRTSRLTHNLTV